MAQKKSTIYLYLNNFYQELLWADLAYESESEGNDAET